MSFQYLQKLQETHSKTKHIAYSQFSIQPYMTDPRFSNSMVSLLFHLRGSMVRDIKSNFSSMYRGELSCPLMCGALDEQRHLLHCPVLLAQLSIAEEVQAGLSSYEDIYGSVDVQIAVILILTRLLDVRKGLLEQPDNSLPVDFHTGPDVFTL